MSRHMADIAIFGAGIGGYETFRTLARLLKKHKRTEKILLIDENSYFTFTPLLHEVAFGSVQAHQAAVPLSELVYRSGQAALRARVINIDPKKRIAQTSAGEVAFKIGVVALGSGVNYMGVPGAEQFTHNVRTLSAALGLQKRLVQLLQQPASDIDVVVVGGGATGVEVAGQLAHLRDKDLPVLYPDKSMRISLVQVEDELIPNLHPSLRAQAKKNLQARKVNLFLHERVATVNQDSVGLGNGQSLPSDLTIWAAGFGNVAPRYLDAAWCERGRLVVTNSLQLPGEPGLYSLGDIALVRSEKTGELCPQLGEAAYAAGRYVARHIFRQLLKKKNSPFRFHSHGTLIPIGDWYALARIPPVTFSGRFAWWLRRTVYLNFFPGWNHKLRIAAEWSVNGIDYRHNLSDELLN